MNSRAWLPNGKRDGGMIGCARLDYARKLCLRSFPAGPEENGKRHARVAEGPVIVNFAAAVRSEEALHRCFGMGWYPLLEAQAQP
jgi:hypothetical protein